MVNGAVGGECGGATTNGRVRPKPFVVDSQPAGGARAGGQEAFHAGGLRDGGAGGGSVTALCWDLLKHGDVDGCIVARMNRDRPWQGEAFIARTYQDLLSSQGSKYMIIPTNAIFQEVRNLPGRYAYVALPCQVHGFLMLAEKDPVLRDKIHCVIGLFCGGSPEPNLVTELLAARGISIDDIADFQFRGDEWPGKMRAIMNDGEVMHRSFERGTIVARDVTRDPDYRTHRIQTKRKGTNAPLRTARWLRKGAAAPHTPSDSTFALSAPMFSLEKWSVTPKACSSITTATTPPRISTGLIHFFCSPSDIASPFGCWNVPWYYRSSAASRPRAIPPSDSHDGS